VHVERLSTTASTDRLLGGGLYETVRLQEHGVRAGRRHVERMQASARVLGLPVPAEGAFLQAIAEAAGAGDAVRVTLHDADGAPELDAVRRVSTMATPARLISLPGWYSRGYLLREHKLTSHFHGVRGRALAVARGVDDALLVERSSGLVGEATNANVVALIGELAVTPPIDGLLPGVTRSLVLALLPGLGIAVEQRPLGLDELPGARGVLLTNSLRALVPARSLDGSALAQPPAELLEALAEALDRAETAELLPLPLG
jgi:branched-subunit amino acid aminotransferase/4-amino-4-deoxychorismate lyase